MKKQTYFILLILFASACKIPSVTINGLSWQSQPTETLSDFPEMQICGNGICDDNETIQTCSPDCVEETQPTLEIEKPVLYIGMMVHLEGWEDENNQAAFERHASLVREYASLFETYGAKLTLESKEMTAGCLRWGDNVLLEMEQRGHAIGLHADSGGNRKYACKNFSSDLKKMKTDLGQLGVTVRHASGVTSHCDWVTAVAQAGFEFTSGVVAYSLSSLPPALRPLEFTNCPSPKECHQPYPFELADRIHPWRANKGSDWIINDPNGQLIIIPESGGLACMHEETTDANKSCVTSDFTQEDVDAYFQLLDQALNLVDINKVNTFYVGWSLGSPLEKSVLEDWLKRIQPYVIEGRVQWMTLPEMYDAYRVWELSQ